MLPAVLVVVLALTGCTEPDDAPDAVPTTATTPLDEPTGDTAEPSSSPERSPDVDDPTEPDLDDGDARAADPVVALAEARARWDRLDGRLYVWSYREEGEGLVDDFCVEGIVGGIAADAAACPFAAVAGGRSVEDWFDVIETVLADEEGLGRTVEVAYDVDVGIPLELVVSGGGIDGLLVTTLDLELFGDAEEAIGGDAGAAAACAAGDPVACYDLGASGGPLPEALVTGNELTQAPDLDVLDRCGSGEPAACHEAGSRGLSGE